MHGERVAAGGERARRRRRTVGPCRRAAPAAAPGRRAARGHGGLGRARRTARRWSTARPPACRLRERRRHLVGGRRSGPASDGLDAAGLEQVAGEAGARGVRGQRAQGGQEDPRPGAGRGEHARRSGRAAPRTPRRGGTRGSPPAGRLGRGRARRPAARPRSRELADPGDRVAARGHVALAPRPRPRPSRSATQPGAQRGDRAARALDLLEERPGRVGQLVGERSTYQEPPAGSITRARCDSSTRSAWVLRAIRRENGVRQAERGVEGQHGDRVGAADARRRSRRPWRAAGSPTGRGGSSSPARRPRAGAGGCARPRTPRRPGPTAGARRAAWRWSGTGRRWPRTGTPAAAAAVDGPARRPVERAQVGDAGGERAAQLLGGGAAGLVVRQRVDDDAPAPAGTPRRTPPGQRHDRRRRPGPSPVRARSPSGSAPRLPRRSAAGDPALGGQREERLGGLPRPSAPGVEHDGRQVEVDAVQRRRPGRRPAVPPVADGQPERGDAVLQVGGDRLPRRGRVGLGVPLADVPAGGDRPGGPGPAHERRPRRAPRSPRSRRVVGGVERPDRGCRRGPVRVSSSTPAPGSASVGDPAGPAHDLVDQRDPLVPARRRELGGQRQLGRPASVVGRHSRLGLGHSRIVGEPGPARRRGPVRPVLVGSREAVDLGRPRHRDRSSRAAAVLAGPLTTEPSASAKLLPWHGQLIVPPVTWSDRAALVGAGRGERLELPGGRLGDHDAGVGEDLAAAHRDVGGRGQSAGAGGAAGAPPRRAPGADRAGGRRAAGVGAGRAGGVGRAAGHGGRAAAAGPGQNASGGTGHAWSRFSGGAWLRHG